MGFTKLDDGLVYSSLISEDDAVFKIFFILLSKTNKEGISPLSDSFVSRITGKPIEEVKRCIKILESPDPNSRTRDNDGRRIERCDGGYKILNYFLYRKKEYANERVDENYNRTGYVYFAGTKERVKIGHSVNPWARLHELKIAVPELELLLCIKGNRGKEREIQENFKDFHVDREWFKRTPEIDVFIQKNTTIATTVATLYACASSSLDFNLRKKKRCGEEEGDESKPLWKTSFEEYERQASEAYDRLITNPEWMQERKKYHPNLDIRLTMEKAFNDFWGQEAGWKHKKKSKTNEIDWDATFKNALTLRSNQVYEKRT